MPAGRTWKISIHIRSHVARFVTTLARQDYVASFVFDSINAAYGTDTVQVDAMEFCIPPLLNIGGRNTILFQDRGQFGFRC